MEHQLFLFDPVFKKKENKSEKLSVLFWNIQNPSLERAKKQVQWLYKGNYDVLVLTEVKRSKGFSYIKMILGDLGYRLVYCDTDNYFTVIACRLENVSKLKVDNAKYGGRLAGIKILSSVQPIIILGVYVPTNSTETKKIKGKETFIKNMIKDLRTLIQNDQNESQIIFGGDLNVLEPNHIPHYNEFDKWCYIFNQLNNNGLLDAYSNQNPSNPEYTWTRGRIMQKLDYIFVNKCNIDKVLDCNYVHEARFSKLSDHSAQVIVIRR